MKKFFPFLFALFTFSSFAQSFVSEAEPQNNQAVVYVSTTDFGALIQKIVVKTSKFYSQKQIDENYDDFEVGKVLYLKNSSTGISRGEWNFTQVFTSDSKGNKIEEKSNFLTFLHEISPENQQKDEDDFDDEIKSLSPFTRSLASKEFRNLYGFKIENDELDIKITKTAAYVCPEAAKFKNGKTSYTFEVPENQNQDSKADKKSGKKSKKSAKKEKKPETIEMGYVYFLPENPESKKIPLILWFHGLKEGGTNPAEMLLGVKTTALAGEKIQSHFENGAAILAPQSPSSWLEVEDTDAFGVHYWEAVDKDGAVASAKKLIKTPFTKLEKLYDKVIVKEDYSAEETDKDDEEKQILSDLENGKKPFAAVSLYSKPVKKLLDDFLNSHPEIDRNRIYVGGCSAGGYMTMNMAIQYPENFAAFFPVCEYYLDSKISDAQIKKLSRMPFWFTYAKNDTTVNPNKHTILTFERLEEAGAKDLHLSVYDDVEWEGFSFPGHYSWIYVLNDDAKDENGTRLFDWLATKALGIAAARSVPE